ncbi:hypothetical protein PRUB_a3842 [Pseudoalteromonas rubra]|uniref:Uncharacterized protein n=1 Tax=Pseudoalteromonas rubra TaxID=43658 RepID=A0A8T0CAA9_9GAMM|nr:hypothetical protein PRUB_a3842 [Pseudoalteromonas rubra]
MTGREKPKARQAVAKLYTSSVINFAFTQALRLIHTEKRNTIMILICTKGNITK